MDVRKNMKKITARFVTGVIAASMLSVNASAMSEYSMFWDSSGLSINGKTNAGQANAGISITDSSGRLVYADQIKSAQDGKFSFDVKSAYSDNMTVRLSDASGETITENSYDLKSGIEIYPKYPDVIARNDDFAVNVQQGNVRRTLTVYDTGITYEENNAEAVRHRRFCEFAFFGEGVTLTVTPKESYTNYEVIADGAELESARNTDGSISIKMNKPQDFILRLDGDKWYGNDLGKVLCVFADGPKDMPTGKNVIYKQAGLHEGNITLTGGQTLYLAPGALVKGKIKVTGTNAKICGNGIIYDPDEITNSGGHMMSIGPSCNAKINGIKIAGRSRGNYNIALYGADDTLIDNVRILSCMISDDGISVFSGTDRLNIQNCFIYNVDNAFVLDGSSLNYPTTTQISGCLIGTSSSVFYPQGHVGIVNATGNTSFEMASGTDKKHGLIQNRIDPYGEASIQLLKIKDFDASHANVTAKLMWMQGCGSEYGKNIKLINVRMREPNLTDIYVNCDEMPESGGYNIEINGLYFDSTEIIDAKPLIEPFVSRKDVVTYIWNESTNKISFLPSAERTGVLLMPTELNAEVTGKKMQLEWTEKNIDADYYNIYKNNKLIGTSAVNNYQVTEFAKGDVFTVSAVLGDKESEKSEAYVSLSEGAPVSNRLTLYKDSYGGNAETNHDDNVRADLLRRFVASPKDPLKTGFDIWHNDNAVPRKSIDPDATGDDNVIRFYFRPKKILECDTNFAGEGFSFTNMASGGLTTVDLSECAKQGYITADVYISDLQKGITTDDIYITLGDLKDCINGDFIADDNHGGNSGNALQNENLVGVKLSEYYSDNNVGTIKTIKVPFTKFMELDGSKWHYSYAGVDRGINLRRLSYIGYIWAPTDAAADYDNSEQFIYMDNVSVQNVIAPDAVAEPYENNETSLKWNVKNSDIKNYDIIKNGEFYINVAGNMFTDIAESAETNEYSVMPINEFGYRAYSTNRVNAKLWNIEFYSDAFPIKNMKSGDIVIKGELMPGVSGKIIACRYDKNGSLTGSQLVNCDSDNKFECTVADCGGTDRITVYFWSGIKAMFPKAVERTLK